MANENTTPQDARIAELTQTVEALKKEIAELYEQHQQLSKDATSKKPTPRKPKSSTPRLFNEAELTQDHKAPEPTEDVLTPYAEKTSQPVQEEEFNLSLHLGQSTCRACGTPYEVFRKNLIRKELDLIPGQHQLVNYYTNTCICPTCRNGKAVTTQAPPPLMKQSMASAYTVSDIMVRKYEEDQGLVKHQKQLAKEGIQVSSATMANWIIRCADTWLKPLYRHMKQVLLSQPVIQASSAPVQMVSADGTPIPSDARIYAYVTDSRCTPIRIFDYNSKQPDTFLKGFTGCLVSDCSPEYTKLQKATHCACWHRMALLWRDAFEEAPTAAVKALDGLNLCNRVMRHEDKCKRMPNQSRKHFRCSVSISTVEEFFLWLKHVEAYPGTKLAEAVSYAREHQAELNNFLDYGEAPATTALAIHALKPFTTGKKVWQFSDTPKGAQSSIMAYSLIQTALASGLNPYDYLYTVLIRLPFYSRTPSYQELESLMPWDPDMKERCTEEE